MKPAQWLLPLLALGAQAQTTVSICESYSYTGTITFIEFKTYYAIGDGFDLPATTSTTINGSNPTSTASRTTSNNYVGDETDAGNRPTSTTTSLSSSTQSSTQLSTSSSASSVTLSSGFTTSTIATTSSSDSVSSSNSASTSTSDSNASSASSTTSFSSSNASNGASSTSTGSSTGSSTSSSTSTSSSMFSNGGNGISTTSMSSSSTSTFSTTSTSTITDSSTASSTTLPTCLIALPGDCSDLTNTNSIALQALVPVCLTALGLQVEVNTAAVNCLRVDLITTVTVGVNIVDCLDDSLLCLNSASSTTTTTLASTSEGSTTTNIAQTTTSATSTNSQGSSSTTTTPAPTPTCGSTGCPNGSGVLNVSTGRTLAQCKALCDGSEGQTLGCVAIQFNPADGACTLLNTPILDAINLGSTEVCATVFYDDTCVVAPDPSPNVVDGGFEDVTAADLGAGPKTAGDWTLNNANVFFSQNAAQPVACLNALPNTCTQLATLNGLALITAVAGCQTALGSNANTASLTCLAANAITLTTTGESIVSCVSAAVLCPRGAQYSTPYGTNFVTIEGDAGKSYSFQQALSNVPTGPNNQNTVTYNYNYDQTGDVTVLPRCTVNVQYGTLLVDTFILSVLNAGWQSRTANFVATASSGDLVFTLDCSNKLSSYDDVLFDEISVTSTPLMTS